MRNRPCVRTALLWLTSVVFAGSVYAQSSDLGEIDFPTSATVQDAQRFFLQGVLLLHSFEYEDARDAFQQAQKLEPGLAMAFWGEAMTYNRPLSNERDRPAAIATLDRLAPTPAERFARAPTEREQGYLQAVEVLFEREDNTESDRAYATAMRKLHEQFPGDQEAASFYALALLGTTQGVRDVRTYMRAAAVVEDVFRRNPRHPGALQYLIHAYDDPDHAPLGLRPAQAYADVAPAAAYALHMPSHVFAALGMWDDVVASNEASWAAADERVQRKKLALEERNYHALWWLQYGYLQQGRYSTALQMLNLAEQDARANDAVRIRWHLALMRAAYVVDAQDWAYVKRSKGVDLSGLGVRAAAATSFVTGLSALKQEDWIVVEKALADLKTLRSLADTEDERLGVQSTLASLEGLTYLAERNTGTALDRLEEAVAAEDEMQIAFGPPFPAKPAHELFGEVLLELRRPAEARAQFEHALARTPQRALSLLGLARAATWTGDPEAARQASAALQAMWHSADADLQALQEISDIVASGSK